MNPTTVYVIDDEPELVELLCDVVEISELIAKGFTRASNFFERVTHFEKDAVLVLDLHMPEMDGIEVMRRLAQTDSPPALILISGTDSGVLHAAEKLGRAHNLQIIASMGKPIRIDRFQQLLEQHSGGERAIPQGIAEPTQHKLTAEELRSAINNNELTLHYQPQMNISTDCLVGLEALVRWQHPLLGLIFPDQFIPLAEQNQLMGELTHWVIEQAVRQEQQWQDGGLTTPISVNISAFDITSLTLPEQMTELLNNNRLDPTHLTLEVTESALMGELVTSLDILTRLRLKGIGLSIDDFGTGYSSLSQLHRVPFTELKIDRSFIADITEDDEALSIVKTCIILGHELNMKVVAEGVETVEHLEQLKQLDCDIAQGYYFSKPLSPEEIEPMLSYHKKKLEQR